MKILITFAAATLLTASGAANQRGWTPDSWSGIRRSGSGSVWEHNGSLVRLQAAGQRRNFVYLSPRHGLPAFAGQILFRGERRGQAYVGTAYLFSSHCGRIGFAVSGSVQPNEREVVLHGTSPRRDRSCTSWLNPSSESQAEFMNVDSAVLTSHPRIAFIIDRDSVSAGDDCLPTTAQPGRQTIR